MIIFGAMAQLVPVVLEAGHFAVDLYYIIYPLLFGGSLLMSYGFLASPATLPYGGIIVLISLLVFVLETFLTINKVKKFNTVMISVVIANIFLFLAICNPGVEAEDVEKVLLEEIEKLKTLDMTKEELDKIKLQTKSDFIYSMQDSSSLADMFGSYFARGDIKPLEEYEENLAKLTPKDIKEVAKKYFKKSNSTTVILKYEGEKDE
jgi:hypothetical protein